MCQQILDTSMGRSSMCEACPVRHIGLVVQRLAYHAFLFNSDIFSLSEDSSLKDIFIYA